MTESPARLAPLITMTDEEMENWRQAIAVEYSLADKLLPELDAQRAARATAYAEGQRAAVNAAIQNISQLGRDTTVEVWTVIDSLLALRDTPAPRREEPHG